MTPELFLKNFGPFFAGFVGFVLLHSYGAQDFFKDFLIKIFGEFFVKYFWRFTYCALSWVLLYPITGHALFSMNPLFYQPLLNFPIWVRALLDIARLTGALITYWAMLQFDFLGFMGIRQLLIGMKILIKGDPPPPMSVTGIDRLEVKGIYRYVRHPMMIGTILVVLPHQISVASLVATTVFVTYALWGTYYEEKRLVRIFGEQYIEYKKRVGSFIPRFTPARTGV